ncbi:hypothetical protein [Candidatus Halocynthiibacter alkanivorans]|uniref:hypothetical protein n=1 Tax=Candidatus Halocynthiibacter alkanivorans TaxID=2267619 RepID=UPI00109C6913|nr:hypothetical protein [Candidatus Halocynthiibacter alkanivorans]
MTREQISHTIMNFWRTEHGKAIAGWSPAQIQAQATAQAALTEAEMDALALIGLDRATAWIEVRNSMALRAPPDLSL